MPRASTKRSPGRRRKPRAWYVSKKFGVIQLSFRRSRKKYGSTTLSKLLNASLREALILSLLTRLSASDTTGAKRVRRALRRIRTTRSLTSAYLAWRAIFTESPNRTDGSFGFLVLVGTKEPSLHFVKLDGPSTRCLSSGFGPLDVVIRRDQIGISHVATI